MTAAPLPITRMAEAEIADLHESLVNALFRLGLRGEALDDVTSETFRTAIREIQSAEGGAMQNQGSPNVGPVRDKKKQKTELTSARANMANSNNDARSAMAYELLDDAAVKLLELGFERNAPWRFMAWNAFAEIAASADETQARADLFRLRKMLDDHISTLDTPAA